MVNWVASFLRNRVAAVSIDSHAGDMLNVHSGPQGSPVSPILFVIYSADFFKSIDNFSPRLGSASYVDDGKIWAVAKLERGEYSSAARSNVALLKRAYAHAVEAAGRIGLRLDPVKRELVHYYPPMSDPARLDYGMEDLPLPDGTVRAARRGSAVRWLGVHFDTRSSFKLHVTHMANRARAAISAFGMLGNTTRGMPAIQLRQAFIACAKSVLLYAAPVWWQGSSSASLHLCRQAELVQNGALRRILPVYRTTPIHAMEREAALPPMRFALDAAVESYALRLRRLPATHPLRVRTLPPGSPLPEGAVKPPHFGTRPAAGARGTRLRRMARMFEDIEELAPSTAAPWEAQLQEHPRVLVQTRFPPRDEAVEAHQQLAHHLLHGAWEGLVMYSDGSMREETDETGQVKRVAGCGFGLWADGKLIMERNAGMGETAEVFDAEAAALDWGVCEAVGVAAEAGISCIYAFTDNQAVIKSALATPTGTSQSTFLRLQHNIREHLEVHDENRFFLSWVPGHAGIEGNEHADEQANEGAQRRARRALIATTARAKRSIKERLLVRWQEHSSTQEANMRQRNSLYSAVAQPLRSLRPPPYLAWPRRMLGRFLQARTGHGDFEPYHRRFNHTDAVVSCHHCGASTQRLHPLTCPAFTAHRHLLRDERGNSLSALDALSNANAFHAFVSATYAYARPPPRERSPSPDGEPAAPSASS